MRIVSLMAALAIVAVPAGALAASSKAQTAAEAKNVATVKAFYEAAINKKDFDAAKAYLGASYKQHNPTAQDGADGLKGFLTFLKGFPDSHSDIKEAFADGDYVILHVLSIRNKGERGAAIVDIFRLDGGKIVEHWDVRQDIPEKPANTNGMF